MRRPAFRHAGEFSAIYYRLWAVNLGPARRRLHLLLASNEAAATICCGTHEDIDWENDYMHEQRLLPGPLNLGTELRYRCNGWRLLDTRHFIYHYYASILKRESRAKIPLRYYKQQLKMAEALIYLASIISMRMLERCDYVIIMRISLVIKWNANIMASLHWRCFNISARRI